ARSGAPLNLRRLRSIPDREEAVRFDSRLLQPSRTSARAAVLAAAVAGDRADRNLRARADADVFHANAGRGVGDVVAAPLAGAVDQRCAIQPEGAAAVLDDPRRLVRVRRQRRVAARAGSADRCGAIDSGAGAGAAAVSAAAVGGAR